MKQNTGRLIITGRVATESSFGENEKARDEQTEAWRKRISKTGLNSKDLCTGARKSRRCRHCCIQLVIGLCVNKIFDAKTKKDTDDRYSPKITVGYCTAR